MGQADCKKDSDYLGDLVGSMTVETDRWCTAQRAQCLRSPVSNKEDVRAPLYSQTDEQHCNEVNNVYYSIRAVKLEKQEVKHQYYSSQPGYVCQQNQSLVASMQNPLKENTGAAHSSQQV